MSKKKWSPQRLRGKGLGQSALPTMQNPVDARDARGLAVRGVVLAVYSIGDEDYLDNGVPTSAVYADVLAYGVHKHVIPQVLITGGRLGMHEGDIVYPRPTTLDTGNDTLDFEKVNPADLDGDHILVGFIDNDLSLPYMITSYPHPNADLGNEAENLGHRVYLTTSDQNGSAVEGKLLHKQPRYIKHRGAFFGVDDEGNFEVDLTRAHTGEYQASGEEPDPANDGTSGNYRVKLPEGSTVTVQIAGGASVTLSESNGYAKLEIGEADFSAMIEERFQNWWNTQVKVFLDEHTHPYVLGQTGPASGGSVPVTNTVYDTTIKTDKLKFND